MRTKTKMLAVGIPVAIIAFFLSHVIWPDPAMVGMGPSAGLVPFFIFLSALEALVFGFGVSFLIFGWKRVMNVPVHKVGMRASFISMVWMLVSWWPHDNMHRVNAMNDYAGLLRIEYLFHFTLIIASVIVAWNFWTAVRERLKKTI